MSSIHCTPVTQAAEGLVSAFLATGKALPAPTEAVTMGDLLVAQAIYQHADTEEGAKAVPERDFSSHNIRHFLKRPGPLDAEAVLELYDVFLADFNNQRQHPRLDELKRLYSQASPAVLNELAQIYVNEVICVRKVASGEVK